MSNAVGFERFARFDGVLPTAEVTVLTVWLSRLCGELSEGLAGVPAAGLEPSERAWRHVAAGLFAVNAEAFGALVPESVLLEASRSVDPSPEASVWARSFERAASTSAALELGRLDAQLSAIVERLSPVSDRALRRQLRIFQGDIAEVATDVSPVH